MKSLVGEVVQFRQGGQEVVFQEVAFEPLNDEKGPPMQRFGGITFQVEKTTSVGALRFHQLARVGRSVGLRNNLWREGWSRMP